MSVLIKGMEMPENCTFCEMWHNIDCHPYQGISPPKSRPDHCPLIPVPPHGRLIDADKEMARVQKLYDNAVAKDPEMGCVNVYEGEIAVLRLAPTVIEAEGVGANEV